jgi:hypothetical protein
MLIHDYFSNYCKIPNVNLIAGWEVILKGSQAFYAISHVDIIGSLILKRPALSY